MRDGRLQAGDGRTDTFEARRRRRSQRHMCLAECRLRLRLRRRRRRRRCRLTTTSDSQSLTREWREKKCACPPRAPLIDDETSQLHLWRAVIRKIIRARLAARGPRDLDF